MLHPVLRFASSTKLHDPLQERCPVPMLISPSRQVFSLFNLPPSSEELGDEVVLGPQGVITRDP